jgi:hypothetical protein
MGVAGCPLELMQVQAAIPEPRFNRFRCVHRDLVFRGGPSDSIWILLGFFWILFRFFSRVFRGGHSKLRSSFANKTHRFAPFRVTSRAQAITHNHIIKHTVTVPRSRTSETIA